MQVIIFNKRQSQFSNFSTAILFCVTSNEISSTMKKKRKENKWKTYEFHFANNYHEKIEHQEWNGKVREWKMYIDMFRGLFSRLQMIHIWILTDSLLIHINSVKTSTCHISMEFHLLCMCDCVYMWESNKWSAKFFELAYCLIECCIYQFALSIPSVVHWIQNTHTQDTSTYFRLLWFHYGTFFTFCNFTDIVFCEKFSVCTSFSHMQHTLI